MTLKNLGCLGYPNYAVDEKGNVFSFLSHRFLKNSLSSTSKSLRVNLYDWDSKPKTVEIHRLVAEMFIPNPDGCLVVNHIDGNRSNNHVSNLEWCSHEHNSVHAVRTGLSKARSLDEATVTNLLSMMEEGYRNVDLAEITGIDYHVIAKIRQGANYRHLWENFEIPSKKHAISIATVLKIKQLLADGYFIEEITKQVKVSRPVVKDIRDGVRFKHVSLERATTTESIDS